MDNVSRFGVFLPTYIWSDDGNFRAFRTKREKGQDGKHRNPISGEDHQIQLPEGTAPALITREMFAAAAGS